ncbi:MAG: hypothetical protein KAU23_01595, partial [Anaerolineales bacterium]|nr:hypothetical protein [Anaerolineales bacterium]
IFTKGLKSQLWVFDYPQTEHRPPSMLKLPTYPVIARKFKHPWIGMLSACPERSRRDAPATTFSKHPVRAVGI